MTDDLKQRLRERQATAGFYSPKPGVIRAVYRDDTLTTEALAIITDLEARLAAAEACNRGLVRLNETLQHRAEVAEACNRGLAKAGRKAVVQLIDHGSDGYASGLDAAIAAYEARRKG